MNKPHFYEIRIEGHLPDWCSDWFESLEIQTHATGETTLRGLLIDQAALLGVLSKIHALNITLVSVTKHSHLQKS